MKLSHNKTRHIATHTLRIACDEVNFTWTTNFPW